MKTRVNLSIEESLLRRAKTYAAKEQVSLSELLTNYLQKLVQRPARKSVIDIVEKMKAPNIPPEKDLIEDYRKNLEKKHGP